MEGSSFSVTLSLFLVCFAIAAHSSYAQNTPQDFLDAHNAARLEVGVGPMTWDDAVASFAQKFADQMSDDCKLEHALSPYGPYGENIFTGYGRPFTAKEAVEAWVGEKAYYDYNSNSCSQGKVCSHYTQVIWQNSLRLGCARVHCRSGWWFVTCNYDPRGNKEGERPYRIGSNYSCASEQMCGHHIEVVSSSSERRGCVVVPCNNGELTATCNDDLRANQF